MQISAPLHSQSNSMEHTPATYQPALLEMRHVDVMRGERLVLRDFSLRVNAGEHLALLGPNGCGKSTLIKTITRELYPVAREHSWMRICGRERWDVSELRTSLGILSDDLIKQCATDATAIEVVVAGFFSATRIFPHHHVTPGLFDSARAALERVGALHLERRRVAELSSGEARRVVIARALVHNPQTLLFDEPTNSLDLSAQQELRSAMRKLAADGVGILLVTHHVSDLIPEIERLVLMRQGTVMADGRKKELLRAPMLQQLFGVNLEVVERDGNYQLWPR